MAATQIYNVYGQVEILTEIEDRNGSIETEAKDVKQNKVRFLGSPVSFKKIKLLS